MFVATSLWKARHRAYAVRAMALVLWGAGAGWTADDSPTASVLPPVATGGVPTTFVITFGSCTLQGTTETFQQFSAAGTSPITGTVIDPNHASITAKLESTATGPGTFGFKVADSKSSCNGAFASGLVAPSIQGYGGPAPFQPFYPDRPFDPISRDLVNDPDRFLLTSPKPFGLRHRFGINQLSPENRFIPAPELEPSNFLLDGLDQRSPIPQIPPFVVTEPILVPEPTNQFVLPAIGPIFAPRAHGTASPFLSRGFSPARKHGSFLLKLRDTTLTLSFLLPPLPSRSSKEGRKRVTQIHALQFVNTQNGNATISHLSFSCRGRKHPLRFGASFNSRDGSTGTMGIGWTHNYAGHLIFNNTLVVVIGGDGAQVPYFRRTNDSSMFTPAVRGVLDVLQQNSDGTYTLMRRNHEQLNFSSAGLLASITDPNGDAQNLSYTSQNLTTVTDSSGRSLTFTYDASNRIVSVSDPLGRSVKYAYDAAGRLISYTDPGDGVTQYTYNVNNQMTQVTDPLGQVEIQITYDPAGRVASRTDALGSITTYTYNSPSSGITIKTDALGDVTRFANDSRGRLNSITNAVGGISSVTYDANNMITSTTDPLGHVRKFGYDVSSNLTQATDPEGNVSKFTYDANFDVLSATNPLSHSTHYTYDSRGNLTRIQDAGGGTTTLGYNSFGQVTSLQDARNSVTQYSYDSSGDLIQRQDALGGVTKYAHDPIGRLTEVTDPLNNHYVFNYDGLDHLTNVTDPSGQISSAKYDANSNLILLTDARKILTQYSYDPLNRLTSMIEAAGASERRITSYVYDADSNVISVKDPNHNTTHFSYDVLNRLVSQTDPLGNIAKITYDADDNVISVIDANGNTNRFAYDTLNRLTTETPSTGDPISHSFDKAGNERSMSDARGMNAYTYDSVNRITSVHTPDGKALTYTYGIDGRLISIMLPDGTKQQFTYDALDRITAARDGAGKTTLFTYDKNGQLLKEAFPSGDSMSYVYDSLGRVLSAANMNGSKPLSSTKYKYDADDNRTEDTSPAGNTFYAYDHLNRLTSVTSTNGQVTKYTYDANGNRTSVTGPSRVTKYTYDKANRLVTAGPDDLSYDHNGNLTNDGKHDYTYDAYDRLAGITGYNTSYVYDGHGFRISQTTPAGTYSYVNDPLSDQTLLEDGPDGKFTNLHAGGLLISESSSSLQLYYHFDSIGDVVTVADNTGKAVQNYLYDAFGTETATDTLGTKNKYKAMRGYTDPGTGLVNLDGSNYYNPQLGRTFSGNIVAGYPNGYVYQDDNPVQ